MSIFPTKGKKFLEVWELENSVIFMERMTLMRSQINIKKWQKEWKKRRNISENTWPAIRSVFAFARWGSTALIIRMDSITYCLKNYYCVSHSILSTFHVSSWSSRTSCLSWFWHGPLWMDGEVEIVVSSVTCPVLNTNGWLYPMGLILEQHYPAELFVLLWCTPTSYGKHQPHMTSKQQWNWTEELKLKSSWLKWAHLTDDW